MATLSERDTDRFFAWALLRPRTVIDAFKSQGPSLSRTLWIVATAVIVFIATAVWQDTELQKLPSATNDTIFGSILADNVVFSSVDVVFYPITIFIWSYLFGFRNDQAGVRAAVDVAYAWDALFAIVATMMAVLLLRQGVAQETVSLMFLSGMAVTIGIYVFCFKNALGMSWLKSILLNVAEFSIVLTGLGIAYFGWVVVDAIMTGYSS